MEAEKILIVEDEQIVAMDLRRILNGIGYEDLLVISKGEEVLEKARNERPDIILMDIRLDGDIDGIDAAALVQEELGIPVIFITANADDETVERAKLTKPFGFIVKPFNQREIHSNIKITLYRHQEEKELVKNQQICFDTFMSLSDAIILIDPGGRIRFLNPMAEYLLSTKQSEMLGAHMVKVVTIVDEESNPVTDHLVSKAIEDGSFATVTDPIYLASDGIKEIPISFSAACIGQERGEHQGVVVLIRDNSEQRKLIEELEQNAFSDPLTGLPNRRFIIQYIRQCIARMNRQKDYLFAVLYLDLDGFKLVNDNFGHTVGDEVLVRTGKLLISSVRPTDTVSRLGGDEYLLLLDNIKSKECVQLVSQRILKSFENDFEIQQQKIRLSTSIGICLGNTRLDDEKIIRNADSAMYSVKNGGKSSFAIFGESHT